MQLLGAIFGGGAKLLGIGLAGSLAAKAIAGGGKGAQPLPQATRDDAEAMAMRDNALLRRKGALADMTNGSTGYELGAGSTGRLVVGN
ncbi:hypothetical protein [Novosphingobium sp.]|uniref:hypothetical protein n=1 Tax=Novosphingobium sp. TaxID=1874826 RepID=UPI00286E1736|nr:hypothetical protein [Novosphingobium sp.]